MAPLGALLLLLELAPVTTSFPLPKALFGPAIAISGAIFLRRGIIVELARANRLEQSAGVLGGGSYVVIWSGALSLK